MATGDLLTVDPPELRFPFELNKQISCTMHLNNNTDHPVAFKVKTTNPKKYCVRPNTGIVQPRSNWGVVVTMQAQKEAPSDLQTKDKFLLQSVIAGSGSDSKDITPEMFNKESGNAVEECKLRVTFVSPPQPAVARPPPKVTEERAYPKYLPISALNELDLPDSTVPPPQTNFKQKDNTNKAYSDEMFLKRKEKELEDQTSALRIAQERDSIIQQNNKLYQELELLKSEAKKGKGGIPLMYVVAVGLVALLLGYLIKMK